MYGHLNDLVISHFEEVRCKHESFRLCRPYKRVAGIPSIEHCSCLQPLIDLRKRAKRGGSASACLVKLLPYLSVCGRSRECLCLLAFVHHWRGIRDTCCSASFLHLALASLCSWLRIAWSGAIIDCQGRSHLMHSELSAWLQEPFMLSARRAALCL